MSSGLSPRIYVACLAAYNAGKLHGTWIDAAQDKDAIEAEVQEMLKNSPEVGAEEWAIHDYEDFGGIKLSEYESFEKVAEIATLLEEHGEAYAVFVDHVGPEYATEESFLEAYQGEWDSLEDYAANWLDDAGVFDGVSDTLRNYFDFEKYAKDLEYSGDIFSDTGPSGKLHVFNNH